MQDPALKELIVFLRERHSAIKALEANAKRSLYEHNDEPGYRKLMEERASAIAGLEFVCEPLLSALPDTQLRDSIEDDLQRFAAGANNSLRIGSVFYMSALLYPDDHKDGEPDNFERLINSLG